MHFDEPDHVKAFRAEAREFLREHLTPSVTARMHESGTLHDWGFHKALAARGWLAAGWPVELGGQGRDPFEMAALDEEMQRAGAPMDGHGTTMMTANTLRVLGSDSQRRALLPGILAGETLVCLGFSEPESGSDVAAAATRAVRDGDGWVINGQKMFTTLAQEAQYVLLLARTNTDVAKHRGLTTFLVPMHDPGVQIQRVDTLGGERTNITYYTDVRVPDEARLGNVDGGWQTMMAALTFERVGSYGATLASLVDHVVDALHEAAVEEAASAEEGRELAHAALGQMAIDTEVAYLLSRKAAWLSARDAPAQVAASMAKLHGTETYNRAAGRSLELFGAHGALARTEPGAPARGALDREFRHAPVTVIYGGTSEIQLGIIAEHGLGLPRAR